MDNQKLIDKIHELQNDTVNELYKYRHINNEKYSSLYCAYLNGGIEAYSKVVSLILLGGEEVNENE